MPTSLILAAALAAQSPADAAAAASYNGRWNVRITDASDTFASGGFQIDAKNTGLSAGLVTLLVLGWDARPRRRREDDLDAVPASQPQPEPVTGGRHRQGPA